MIVARRAVRAQLPRSIDDADCREELLRRADVCRARLQPRLTALLAADDDLALRFPYHRRDKEYDEEDARRGGAVPSLSRSDDEAGNMDERDAGAKRPRGAEPDSAS